MLWRLQRNFFDRQGIEAWTAGTVPHYITSNPWIASSYAQLALAWLEDCAGAGAIDPARPIYIVELGCGSGRFGYLFLNRLLELLGRSDLGALQIRYVLTDFTDSNLDPLRNHPHLRPLVEAGVVDFARYDAGQDVEIHLSQSGEVLSPETLTNPLLVVANYVFDGIPQDCFSIRGGRLHENLVTLTSKRPEPDLDDPELLSRLTVDYEERPLPPDESIDYYGDPELDGILREYAGKFDDTTFLFPCAAIRCMRSLGRLSGGKMLLISGDKGYSEEEFVSDRGLPEMAVHGSFSLMVNYHAIGRWYERAGGAFLHASHLHSSINVTAGLLGTPSGETAATRRAFEELVERRGPDDFFDLKKSVEHAYEAMTLEQLLSWIRFADWDSNILLGCYPQLMDRLESAPEILFEEVRRTVLRVWETHFPIRETRDVAFHLGVLLIEAGFYADALPLLQESISLYGTNPATVYNIGLCRYHLGELEAALECVDQALEAEPGYEAAETLREEIGKAAVEQKRRSSHDET